MVGRLRKEEAEARGGVRVDESRGQQEPFGVDHPFDPFGGQIGADGGDAVVLDGEVGLAGRLEAAGIDEGVADEEHVGELGYWLIGLLVD